MTLLGDFAQSFRAFKTEFRAALWINIKTQNRNLSKVESMNKTLAMSPRPMTPIGSLILMSGGLDSFMAVF